MNIRKQQKTNFAAIYPFAPDWEEFQHLNLDKKFFHFEKHVLNSQQEYARAKHISDELEICLITAPESIFSPKGRDSFRNYTYSYSELKRFEEKVKQLQSQLNPDTFVIAGAIDYATPDLKHYMVTTYAVTKDKIHTYDKIKATEKMHETYIVQENKKTKASLKMHSRKKCGLFTFKNKIIGLEICQDHEEATLLNNKVSVDIHVVISAGQTI